MECLKTNNAAGKIVDAECKREVEKKMVAAAADIRQGLADHARHVIGCH